MILEYTLQFHHTEAKLCCSKIAASISAITSGNLMALVTLECAFPKLHQTIKDSVMGKSGYQCARGDFSTTGKILFGQTEVNLGRGSPPPMGIYPGRCFM